MSPSVKKAFDLSDRRISEEDINLAAQSVSEKWDLQRFPPVELEVQQGTRKLAGCVHGFLEAVSDLEMNSDIRISDHGSPPRIYFETVDREIPVFKKKPELAELLQRVEDADKEKALTTLDVMESLKRSVQENCPKDSFGELGDRAYFKILGSMVRQVIDLSKSKLGAEINFSKNPVTRADIVSSREAAPPAPEQA